MYKTGRYLAYYLQHKFAQTISGISEDELTNFLNQTGWELHDSDVMIKRFLAWRTEKAIVRPAAAQSA